MKKIFTPCLIACALTVSSNSFAMLTRSLATARTRPFGLQRQLCTTKPNSDTATIKQTITEAKKAWVLKSVTYGIENQLIATELRNTGLMQKILEQNDIIKQLNKFNLRNPQSFKVNEHAIDKLTDRFEELEKTIRE